VRANTNGAAQPRPSSTPPTIRRHDFWTEETRMTAGRIPPAVTSRKPQFGVSGSQVKSTVTFAPLFAFAAAQASGHSTTLPFSR
jgi:hypothetical protein